MDYFIVAHTPKIITELYITQIFELLEPREPKEVQEVKGALWILRELFEAVGFNYLMVD